MDKDYTRDNHEKTLRRRAQADVTRVSMPVQDKRTTTEIDTSFRKNRMTRGIKALDALYSEGSVYNHAETGNDDSVAFYRNKLGKESKELSELDRRTKKDSIELEKRKALPKLRKL